MHRVLAQLDTNVFLRLPPVPTLKLRGNIGEDIVLRLLRGIVPNSGGDVESYMGVCYAGRFFKKNKPQVTTYSLNKIDKRSSESNYIYMTLYVVAS